MKLQMMLSKPDHYMKVPGMHNECLLAKHQLYMILQYIERYCNLSGMPEDSLTVFVHGLLQDFC